MSSADGTPTILTCSGHYFSFIAPETSEFDIYDIAHHLSNLCRFAGATRTFYSVAQHAVLVSELLPLELKLAGLNHDDAEAFLVDIPRPLKQLLPDYKRIEERVEREVLRRFDLPYPMHELVHTADRLALYIEQRDLMPVHEDHWAAFEGIALEQIMAHPPIDPLPPEAARDLFLTQYARLTGVPVPIACPDHFYVPAESQCPFVHAGDEASQ